MTMNRLRDDDPAAHHERARQAAVDHLQTAIEHLEKAAAWIRTYTGTKPAVAEELDRYSTGATIIRKKLATVDEITAHREDRTPTVVIRSDDVGLGVS